MAIPGEPESAFITACRGQEPRFTPVWFMRQAGRSLPEYRALRGPESILEAVRDPALAAEITIQPVRRYGVDAAILFSDIMVPVAAVGFGIQIAPGLGPVTEEPFRARKDLERLPPFEPAEDASWTAETVRIVTRELNVPVIGFAGGPFTVATYLIEGKPSRDHSRAKSLMYTDPALWHELLDRLAQQSLAALRDQVQAGASAVQLFDSWVGALSPQDFRTYVLPATRRIFEGISELGVPMIHFGVGTGELLGQFVEAGADVLGVDWRIPLREAASRGLGAKALQGNLDPANCLAPWDVVADAVRQILRDRPDGIGHIFNLGHGVLPETDPDVLSRIVDLVHSESRTG